VSAEQQVSERTHSYEVYVCQNGRWELHARHAPNQRDVALQEAKGLASIRAISSVKVVHDVFDAATGKSTENVIYNSVINCWLFRAKGMKSVDRVTNEIVATQGQGNT
jgi:hypothetical protein